MLRQDYERLSPNAFLSIKDVLLTALNQQQHNYGCGLPALHAYECQSANCDIIYI